jgi:Flp pilus assembly protein TadG
MNITDVKTRPQPRQKGVIRRFGKNRRGTVAIEFAMLALPFFLLIFATIETCMSFAASQLLQNTVDNVTRRIRTGEFERANINATSLKAAICDGMSLMVVDDTCPELFVDLKVYNEFADIPFGITRLSNGDVDLTGFTVNPGGAEDKMQLRAFMRWPVISDVMKARLENIDKGSGAGKILLFATMTWRNEPFVTAP